MKIPKKLKIGGHVYRVSFHKEGHICENEAALAITMRTKGVIEINASLMESEIGATLFHEIFHVINAQLDHALLDSLSQQIYQVLSDNKMLK